VIEPPTVVVSLDPFLKKAKALGLSDNDITAIENLVAYDPTGGDLVKGSEGVRKRRIILPGRTKGKSGGARIFTLYFSTLAPTFILTMIDKSQQSDLSGKDRTELTKIVQFLKGKRRS
jgi:hypothetical protein